MGRIGRDAEEVNQIHKNTVMMPIIHSLSYGPALRAALISAKKRIYICTYVTILNFKKRCDLIHILFIILQQKLAEGIDIRFIIDHPRKHKTNYHATQFLIRRLKTWKFPFWVAPARNTCHAKVILIDDLKVFIGSHNLAKSSFHNPLEMSLELEDPETCKKVKDWFDGHFKDPGFDYYPPDNYKISDIYP